MTTSSPPVCAPAAAITTEEHRRLLDIIDSLRAHGLGRYIDLPEIIVCGDQSAGKSSVLEAISGLRFPTKDGLCTRFATELILRRGEGDSIKVSITPGERRDQGEREILERWRPNANIDVDGLEAVTTQAFDALGATNPRNFYDDVLRIELIGPSHPHLTMVDLPGLFKTGDGKVQSDSDAETVCRMVQRYMARPRSIILAVVSAKSQYVLQEVTKLAKAADPKGQKTLGLITKPDTLDVGSESEAQWVGYAQNKENMLQLGWHVIRNRKYEERNSTAIERDAVEAKFFSSGIWASVDPAHCGVNSLKVRLSSVLKDQILSQLPSLLGDVEKEIKNCGEELHKLGPERKSRGKQLKYLLDLGERYTLLMGQAISGSYTDPFFGNIGNFGAYPRRLRAIVSNRLSDFAIDMRQNGHSQLIVDSDTEAGEGNTMSDAPHILRSDYIQDVAQQLRFARGRELPGLFNPLIVDELFKKQCEPWNHLAQDMVDDIMDAVHKTARLALEHVAAQDVLEELLIFIRRQIDELEENVKAKVHELLTSAKKHAITYNKQLVENVQRSQQARHKRAIRQQIQLIFGLHEYENTNKKFNINPAQVVDTLTQGLEVDMDSYGSSIAVDYMQAYYDVARDRYVDDVSVLAVEDCLITKLSGLLKSDTVYDLVDEEITRLVGETETCTTKRKELEDKRSILKQGLWDLKSFHKHDGHVAKLVTRARDSPSRADSKREEVTRSVSRTDDAMSMPGTASSGSSDQPDSNVSEISFR